MKAHELLNSPAAWCQESPAKDLQGHKLHAFDPRAVKWCALAAVQKAYPPSQWEKAMDRLLLALCISELGLTQMTKTDRPAPSWSGTTIVEVRFERLGRPFSRLISERG